MTGQSMKLQNAINTHRLMFVILYIVYIDLYLRNIDMMRKCQKESFTLEAVAAIIVISHVRNRWKLFEVSTSYDLKLQKSYKLHYHDLH